MLISHINHHILFHFQVISQKQHLVTELKRHKADEAMLQDQLDKTVQKYSALCKEHEKLQHLFKSNEVQLQLNNSKTKVMELKSLCEYMYVASL